MRMNLLIILIVRIEFCEKNVLYTGQILIAVGGVGYYQERGKSARRLLSGDVVEIAPNIEHWHGASPDSWFSHIAVECNPQTNKNTWLEPVSDEEYGKAVNDK